MGAPASPAHRLICYQGNNIMQKRRIQFQLGIIIFVSSVISKRLEIFGRIKADIKVGFNYVL